MKIRFYFDYSDYRSYLMLKTLNALGELPGHVQWIAVDAYSLRALSGAAAPQTNAERTWLQQDAMRFAAKNKLPFVWKSETLHSGHALRAGIWLMQHAPEAFESFSKKMLEAIWAQGKQPDFALVRTILTETVSRNNALETIFSDASAKESFLFQDACLQQALADGVFDVATIVMDDALFCRYDQVDDIKRQFLTNVLSAQPQHQILNTCIELVMAMDATERAHLLEAILKTDAQPTEERTDNPEITIRHTISQPQTTWRLPQQPVRGELQIRALAINTSAKNAFLEAIERAPENALTILTHAVEIEQTNELLEVLKQTAAQRYLIAKLADASGYVFARSGAKDAQLTLIHDDAPYAECQIKSWKCLIVAPNMANNINAARHAAKLGVNVIVRAIEQTDAPNSEAWGCLAHAWVAELENEKISIIDTESRRLRLLADQDFKISSTYRHKQAPVWYPPAPRTLLLCDHALKLGEVNDGADLELASRSQNLEVATALQRSELSSSRTSERLRIGENLIQLIPLNGEQVCIPEMIAHKVLDTLNKAPSESLPMLVNYWNDLNYDTLESLRSIYAAIVQTWHMPLAIVIFNQIVEVWQCNAQNIPYRVEKDDELYTLDLAEMTPAEHCFERVLARLGRTAEDFVQEVSE